MSAPTATDPAILPRGSRTAVTPWVELAVVGIAIAVVVGTYFTVQDEAGAQLLAPQTVALLLVANLVAGIVLMILFGRRVAHKRAAQSPVGGEGRLHVRLMLLFSSVAAVPAIIVTIFASLLFQYGALFWYSDRARGVFENATSLTRASYEQILQRWDEATVTMAAEAGQLQLNAMEPVIIFKVLEQRFM